MPRTKGKAKASADFAPQIANLVKGRAALAAKNAAAKAAGKRAAKAAAAAGKTPKQIAKAASNAAYKHKRQNGAAAPNGDGAQSFPLALIPERMPAIMRERLPRAAAAPALDAAVRLRLALEHCRIMHLLLGTPSSD